MHVQFRGESTTILVVVGSIYKHDMCTACPLYSTVIFLLWRARLVLSVFCRPDDESESTEWETDTDTSDDEEVDAEQASICFN